MDHPHPHPIVMATLESLPTISWLIREDTVSHLNNNTNHGHDQSPVRFGQTIPVDFTTTPLGKTIEGFTSDGTVNSQRMNDRVYV